MLVLLIKTKIMIEQLQRTESNIEKTSRIKRAAQFLMKAFTQKLVETGAVEIPVSESALPTPEKPTPVIPMARREQREVDSAFSYATQKPEATNVIPLSSRVAAESTPLPQRTAGELEEFKYFNTRPRLTSVPNIDPLTSPLTVSENEPTPMFDTVSADVAAARQEQLETPEFARLKAEFAARETHQ